MSALWSFFTPREDTRDGLQHGAKKKVCGNCKRPVHEHDKRLVDASNGLRQYEYRCEDGGRYR